MKKLLILTLMLMTTQAMSQTCYREDGSEIILPDYAKLVIVPFWVDAETLKTDQKVAVEVNDVPPTRGADEDVLCISPCVTEE